MKMMNELLEFTINAHGGLENWRKFKSIAASLKVGGVVWEARGQAKVVENLKIVANTKEQYATLFPFSKKEWRSTFTPDRIAILEGDKLIEELHDPRSSFEGYDINSKWTLLQLGYFAGYAMWGYLNAPFDFAEPGYQMEEIEPWEENGEHYRRLKVTFPEGFAAHSRIETLYIDQSGLIKRLDYDVEIIGNSASANYIDDYVIVEGIKIGTKRRVYLRQQDNTPKLPSPLLVAIDISDVVLK